MTNFDERTNTLLYKNIPLTLYSRKGWCWLCVRGELETGTDYYILTPSSSDHSSTYSAFWLGCSTVGQWGLQSPQSASYSHAGILSPTGSNCNWDLNWPTQTVCGTWLYNCLMPTCFLWAYASAPNSTCPQVKVIFRYLRPGAPVSLLFYLFTQVHLLIDGSVGGQYVTSPWNQTNQTKQNKTKIGIDVLIYGRQYVKKK